MFNRIFFLIGLFILFFIPSLKASDFDYKLWTEYLNFIQSSTVNIEFEEWLNLKNNISKQTEKNINNIDNTIIITIDTAVITNDPVNIYEDTIIITNDIAIVTDDTVNININISTDDTISVTNDTISEIIEDTEFSLIIPEILESTKINETTDSDINLSINEPAQNFAMPKLINFNADKSEIDLKILKQRNKENKIYQRKKQINYFRGAGALLIFSLLLL